MDNRYQLYFNLSNRDCVVMKGSIFIGKATSVQDDKAPFGDYVSYQFDVGIVQELEDNRELQEALHREGMAFD